MHLPAKKLTRSSKPGLVFKMDISGSVRILRTIASEIFSESNRRILGKNTISVPIFVKLIRLA